MRPGSVPGTRRVAVLGTAVERPTLRAARYGHGAEGLDSSFWPNDGRFPTLLYLGSLSVGFPVKDTFRTELCGETCFLGAPDARRCKVSHFVAMTLAGTARTRMG